MLDWGLLQNFILNLLKISTILKMISHVLVWLEICLTVKIGRKNSLVENDSMYRAPFETGSSKTDDLSHLECYPNRSSISSCKKECEFWCVLGEQPLFVACQPKRLKIRVIPSSRRNDYPAEKFLKCPQTKIVVDQVRMWHACGHQLCSPLQRNLVCFG